MYFFFGLGNPGDEYDGTRHNIGFACADRLADHLGMSFSPNARLQGLIAKKDNMVIVKPTTFMNSSGECVQKVIAFYDKPLVGKNDLRTVYVLHDDLDLRFGQTKLVYNSGPKGHNGINSVRQSLGTESFWYGRMGVDGRTPETCVEPHAYVLSRFDHKEQSVVQEMITTVVDKLYALVSS